MAESTCCELADVGHRAARLGLHRIRYLGEPGHIAYGTLCPESEEPNSSSADS